MPELAAKLLNDDQVLSEICETNACGWGLDTYEIYSAEYNPDEHQIEFDAHVILSGEQHPDKGYLGTRVSVELSGVIKRKDETWFVDSYEISSCGVVDYPV